MSDHTPRWPRRWPVAVISLPAAVATWSGWVGLGEMTGFGKVKLLPGIWDSLQINTAVTLPIGVEAYAAYALSAALTSAPVTGPTRRFAWISAVCALSLGMGAQVAYHLLQNAHRTAAPWQITTAVSCLPVLVLGLGAVLAHMLHRDRTAAAAAEAAPVVDEAPAPSWVFWPQFVPAETGKQPTEIAPEPDVPEIEAGVPDVPEPYLEAAQVFAEDLERGHVPSIRAVKRELRVGQDRAKEVREHLAVLASR
jgi:hypothetical protein